MYGDRGSGTEKGECREELTRRPEEAPLSVVADFRDR